MVAEYTIRSLPERTSVTSTFPNDGDGRKAKSGRVVLKVCHECSPLRSVGRPTAEYYRGHTRETVGAHPFGGFRFTDSPP